jgi:hypothetical protein
MTSQHRVVAVLLRLYPRDWRRQYGDELRDVLARRPLTAATVGDVLRAALWQRARSLTPGTLLGLASMAVIVASIVGTSTADGAGGVALIRPSYMTFPPIKVAFFESGIFWLLLMACGGWTQLRRGHGAARAAAWMTIVAGLPISALGGLMWLGVTTVQAPAGLPEHPILPYALNLAIAPLLRAPESAIWGFIGGRLGRWLGRRRQAVHA